jgi:hypothetical protein
MIALMVITLCCLYVLLIVHACHGRVRWTDQVRLAKGFCQLNIPYWKSSNIVIQISPIIVKAFKLVQQMLSPMLYVECNNIVDKTCFAKGWFNVNVVPSTVKHGQTWEVFDK